MLKYLRFFRSLTIPQLLLGMVLYGVLPVDVIPDVIPVLGQIDDVLVILILLAIIIMRRKRAYTVKDSEKSAKVRTE